MSFLSGLPLAPWPFWWQRSARMWGFHKIICVAMPLTGISTLSILLIGQMIDLDADKATGKWGIAARKGNKATSLLYLAVQLFLCLNIILLSVFFADKGWPILLSLIPYVLFLPRIRKILHSGYENPDMLKQAAKNECFASLAFLAIIINRHPFNSFIEIKS